MADESPGVGTWGVASGPSRWIDTSIRSPRNFSELEIFHRSLSLSLCLSFSLRVISRLDCFVINVYARRITVSFCFAPRYFVICPRWRDARRLAHRLLTFPILSGSLWIVNTLETETRVDYNPAHVAHRGYFHRVFEKEFMNTRSRVLRFVRYENRSNGSFLSLFFFVITRKSWNA